jgi:hypothetical protein
LLLFGGRQVDKIGEADISAGDEEFVADFASFIWPIVEFSDLN